MPASTRRCGSVRTSTWCGGWSTRARRCATTRPRWRTTTPGRRCVAGSAASSSTAPGAPRWPHATAPRWPPPSCPRPWRSARPRCSSAGGGRCPWRPSARRAASRCCAAPFPTSRAATGSRSTSPVAACGGRCARSPSSCCGTGGRPSRWRPCALVRYAEPWSRPRSSTWSSRAPSARTWAPWSGSPDAASTTSPTAPGCGRGRCGPAPCGPCCRSGRGDVPPWPWRPMPRGPRSRPRAPMRA